MSMLIPVDVMMEALEAADTRPAECRAPGHQIVPDLHDIDFSPMRFAQFIADYVMENRPTSTTSTPEQEPHTAPGIGGTIPIRDVQPGMTVKINSGGKHFHATAETIQTGYNSTTINGYAFRSTAPATIIPRWIPPMRHVIN